MGVLDTFLQVDGLWPFVVPLLLLLALLAWSRRTPPGARPPPGPRALPIIGNLHMLNTRRLHESLLQLSKQYGSVFTVYLGPRRVVVLAGYETVMDALVNYPEEFGARDIWPIFRDTNKEHGIAFANGECWRTMRKFTLSTLKDFGMGKRILEEKILEEIGHLTQVFQEQNGKPFEARQDISVAVSNIICSIVYGKRFEYNDPNFVKMIKRAAENTKIVGTPGIQIYNCFPFLGPLISSRAKAMENMEQNKAEILSFARESQRCQQGDDVKGFIDAFLQKQKQESHNPNSLFNDENLVITVLNLFVAGTDTTAMTICWCLLLMAKYPEVQLQLQQEIDSVIGTRPPKMEDQKEMTYAKAVIHEIQRFSNIVPLNLPHQATTDVHFRGYLISKGTTVIPLLTSVLRDEAHWATPNEFNPSHFLDADGNFVENEAFLPFSAGPRVCVGETLTRMELFLSLTALLQNFTFTPPQGVTTDQLDLTPAIGLLLSPTPQELCAIRRSQK
ncbi:cytochrome P450 2K1-like [Erpetoichthys calabaricus]|uniref:cytochrome P450 2K1-like n=1 Tax=Erpetoichthys calabaricus TaxID=27687 RepID=UPI0022344E1C|nr:cytochrome P450 2K1-like [Erpetoichthys calabaricus]